MFCILEGTKLLYIQLTTKLLKLVIDDEEYKKKKELKTKKTLVKK